MSEQLLKWRVHYYYHEHLRAKIVTAVTKQGAAHQVMEEYELREYDIVRVDPYEQGPRA